MSQSIQPPTKCARGGICAAQTVVLVSSFHFVRSLKKYVIQITVNIKIGWIQHGSSTSLILFETKVGVLCMGMQWMEGKS